MKIQTKISIILATLSAILFSYSGLLMKKNIEVQAERLNCLSIGTYENAQKLYQSDTKKYKALDRDHDGIACESLPHAGPVLEGILNIK